MDAYHPQILIPWNINPRPSKPPITDRGIIPRARGHDRPTTNHPIGNSVIVLPKVAKFRTKSGSHPVTQIGGVITVHVELLNHDNIRLQSLENSRPLGLIGLPISRCNIRCDSPNRLLWIKIGQSKTNRPRIPTRHDRPIRYITYRSRIRNNPSQQPYPQPEPRRSNKNPPPT